MNEQPHLNANGTDFYNGSQWAHVTHHHLSDSIPAWGYDLLFIVILMTSLIGLTLLFARS